MARTHCLCKIGSDGTVLIVLCTEGFTVYHVNPFFNYLTLSLLDTKLDTCTILTLFY